MEIEINFRFDENGRTANTKIVDGGDRNNNKNEKEIDYGYKVAMTDLNEWFAESSISASASASSPSPSSPISMMDDILLDCEISDNLIMPRTYWMPANGTTKARCALEQFALDVFHHHVPSGFEYDRETSGAEWWCQLRPSPEMGRHNNTACSSSEKDDDEFEKEIDPFANGISFHVDKDEELRILTGGSTHVHPHVSTITYLTDLGSPTLIVDCMVHPLTGDWIVPEDNVEGFVSWPSVGKHTSFDGRYLHASPPDLMGDKNAFAKQLEELALGLELKSSTAVATKVDDDDGSGGSSSTTTISNAKRKRRRRCRRVTFLVNVWLNYKPYDVNRFPESMIDKMSGRDENTRRGLQFGDGASADAGAATSANTNTNTSNNALTALHVQNTRVRSDQATELSGGNGDPRTEKETETPSSTTTTYKAQHFSWPLGDKRSGERLECMVPFLSIAESSVKGGNVQIQWQTKTTTNDDCFRLFDGRPSDVTTIASPTALGETKDGTSSSSSSSKETADAKSSKRPRIGE
jgi:hypothetical protein